MMHELTQLCRQVREARDSRTPLYVRGGNTKSFYGEPRVAGTQNQTVSTENAAVMQELDMRGYQGVISYQPSELVITARAGTLLSEIEETLAQKGQVLAFEPPRFGPSSTLGGCVASGLSGPRRMAAGSLSDFVLGARLLHSSGELLAFGGEVMKNVAGYDVSRLLAGSLGSLGPMIELSVKVMPMSPYEQTRLLDIDESDALRTLDTWRGLPLPISASAWLPGTEFTASGRGCLYVRISGSVPAVNSAVTVIGGERLDDDSAAAHWESLRDQTHAFFVQRPMWRIAVPPATAPLELGASVIEWNGGLRWVSTDMPAQDLRRKVEAHGGFATLYRYEDKPVGVPVFHPLSEALERINRRMMKQFDPAGIFYPGKRLPIMEG